MNALNKHNQLLRLIFESDAPRAAAIKELDSFICLDGIDIALRHVLSIEEMREAGSFFTGQDLATETVKSIIELTNDSIILDPTCGAGNLLIECSRSLDIKKTLSETLSIWGSQLWGFDIHAAFIEAAKLRIILEALRRGAVRDCSLVLAMSFLTNIRQADAMEISNPEVSSITHAVLNPPFSIWPSPKTSFWNPGKVNAAGVIFEKYLDILPDQTKISAILPDVIRSGSRYASLRSFIETKMAGEAKIWGRFNSKTDVDVFILNGIKKQSLKKISWYQDTSEQSTLQDLYEIQIGPLVAYRDIEEGEEHPYFYTKNTPSWSQVTTPTDYRKFKGRLLSPPLVLVKRTSSPSNEYRAIATIIDINQPIAVENHLIAIKPKSNKIEDCLKLIKILKSKKTNTFLNDRIRLRHLTVKAVKEIPLK